MASDEDRDEFSVVEFYDVGTHSYIWRGITAKEAVELASICAREAVRRGNPNQHDRNVKRIIITDGGDNTVFEWTRGKGITYPKDYDKLYK